MSGACTNMDNYCGLYPGDDDSIAPPPPPPPPPPSAAAAAAAEDDQRRELYGDGSDPIEFDEPELFEQTLNEHEYLREPVVYDEEYDSGEESSQMTVSSKKRRTLLKTLLVALVLIVAALAIATSLSKKKSENRANDNNIVASSMSSITAVPVESPTNQPDLPAKPTEMPILSGVPKSTDTPVSTPTPQPILSGVPKPILPTEMPILSGVPVPTKYPSPIYIPSNDPYYPPHVDPQPGCNDEIHVNKSCYLFGEPIEITYKLCYPEKFFWFGIFQQGSCDRYGRMRKNPFYWELPCGGQGEYWADPQEHGTVTFNPNLSAGQQYQVYSISNMNRPYRSTSSSYGFVVSKHCPMY
jgi:hypothetical protein